MRKQTEISVIANRPHLFRQSTLMALGIKVEEEACLSNIETDFSFGNKNANFFECGEGWLTIIEAFADSLDHFIHQVENSGDESEINVKCPIFFIDGAHRHQNRLCIGVDVSPNIDDDLANKIRAIQEFSTVMSGFICEVCGTTLKKAEQNKRVHCAVCHLRHAQK